MNSTYYRVCRGLMMIAGLLAVPPAAYAQQQIVDGCMQDVSNRYGGPGNLNCTANDISITAVAIPNNPVDGCDFLGDTTTFSAIATVQSTATSRYDIGAYLALDSGDALTGSCLISTLPYTPANNNGACTGSGAPYPCCTGAGTGTCTYVDLDGTGDTGKVCTLANTQPCNDNTDCGSTGSVFVCTGVATPFACCTGAGTGSCGTCPASNVAGLQDTCGDISSSNLVYYEITNITLTCLDTDNDGFLDVTSCMSWDNQNGNGHLCRSPLAAFPNTPAKCNCQPALKIPINVPKTIQVCKDVVPNGNPGAFNLTLDGSSFYCSDGKGACAMGSGPCGDGTGTCQSAIDVGDGFCTSNIAVETGSHTVAETMGTGTSGADFHSNIECYDVAGRCTGDGSISCFVDATCAAFDAGTCDLTPTLVGSCTNCTSKSLNIGTMATKIVCTISNINNCYNADGSPIICNDGNDCTTDSCVPATGCVYTNNTIPCDDGSACTSGDVCSGGVCAGTAVDCNDGNSCTNDGCTPGGGCFYTNNANPCNDGNACTTGDVCSGGTCVGGAAPVCIDGNVCTTDSCDPATGCTYTNNTLPCSDGNACTTSDICSAGACEGSSLICDDGNVCTTDGCNPASGCTYTNNMVSCNDGNACTTNDTCSGGICAGTPVSCDDDNLCTDDSCDPAIGCSYSFNSSPCDDGMPCTDGDVCAAGMCQGSPNGLICCATPAECDDGNVCTTDSCQEGVCVWTFNSNPCDDGSACTTSDVCVMGACVGGPPPNCNDGNVCTDDQCDPSIGCVHLHNTAPCSDGNACTTFDTCSAGFCVGGPPPTCNDNNVCTTDSCDPAIGCVYVDNSNPCDDGSACTTNDTCSGGNCEGGPPPDCDDGNLCTDDFCDSALGCQYANNSLPCDDGSACTTLDICFGGSCVGGPAPVCNDGNVCTTDTCDPASGCVFTNNTDPCDDGNACTTLDTCAGGSCVGGPPPVCNDDNPCTDDSCNPSTGCIYSDNSNPCDDGNACTTSDVCFGGTCTGGPTLICNDNNQCTDDTCNPASGCEYTNDDTNICGDEHPCTSNDVCVDGDCVGTPIVGCSECGIVDQCTAPNTPFACCTGPGTGVGDCVCVAMPCFDESCQENMCVYTPNTDPCDDGSACTTSDVCTNGMCLGGPPPICEDENICTDDSCDPGLGCVYVNNSNPCSDGNACTKGDVCSGGSCSGGPLITCDDSNFCTTDTCDPATGCVYTNNTLPCNDGNACTTNDVCSGGGCEGGPPLVCNDGNICTDDSCNPSTGCLYTSNAEPCDDGNACTTDDTCSGGSCVGGAAPDCDDGNVCTDDSCNPAKGCTYANNSNKCSDGDPCTTPDVCMGGSCISGPPVTCADGTLCNDPDLCVGGACTHAPPPDCDDGSSCTVDGCDPATGVCINNEEEDCSIPTTSTWGLVVLGLMLLIGAKLCFGRRVGLTPV